MKNNLKNGILATALALGGCESPILMNRSYGGIVALGPKGVAVVVYQREWKYSQVETKSYGGFVTNEGKGKLNIGDWESHYITPFCDQVEYDSPLFRGQYGPCLERWK